MAAALYFTYACVAVLLTVNALRRPSPPSSRFPPLWLPAMITSELAVLWLVARVAISAGFIAFGALRIPMGWVALGMVLASELGLVVLLARSRRAQRAAGDPIPHPPGTTRWDRWMARASLPPDGVTLHTHLPYHDGLTLDLYERPDRDRPSPVLVYVHGGGWTGGGPHKQARALFHHLALRGWAVATIRYPLSPEATFPDHLIGVKRALAWVKGPGAAEWDLDPDRAVIAGGSAGGHLAALDALTERDPRYQPGFEEADTSVRGCVPMYGVYDFLNRNRTRHDWPVIPKAVMKARPEEDPDRYREASPLDRVHPDAPPFLVVHGSHDSLVPPAEAHHFVDALRDVGVPVEYLEVPGGQHAFDALASPRTRAAAARITEFCDEVVGAPHPVSDT